MESQAGFGCGAEHVIDLHLESLECLDDEHGPAPKAPYVAVGMRQSDERTLPSTS